MLTAIKRDRRPASLVLVLFTNQLLGASLRGRPHDSFGPEGRPRREARQFFLDQICFRNQRLRGLTLALL